MWANKTVCFPIVLLKSLNLKSLKLMDVLHFVSDFKLSTVYRELEEAKNGKLIT